MISRKREKRCEQCSQLQSGFLSRDFRIFRGISVFRGSPGDRGG